MFERRNYKEFAWRARWQNVPFGILAFIVFIFMFIDWSIRGPRFWIASSIFAGSIISMAIMDYIRFRRFDCPQCHERLPKPNFDSVVEGDPILFVCDRCKIEWDSGVKVRNSD